MKEKQWMGMIVLASVAGLLAGACTINVDRNADGSLRVEAQIPESSIQQEISAALEDPLITDLQTDLRSGYISVTAKRKRLSGDQVDLLTFRLTLGASEGHLTASISEAKVNDQPVDESLVEVWNQRLANRLEKSGKRNPDSRLQSVNISDDAINFVWQVETPRSKDS